MKKEPLISVIVPIYNVEDYLKECIESIVNQTYKDLEIILVDDGSVDDSSKICDSYANIDSRIIVVHKENEGVSVARNVGISIANGEYIQFIDSDDYVESDMIKVLYNLIIDNNSDIAICNHYVSIDDQNICEYDDSITIFDKMGAIKELMLGVRIWNYVFDKLFKKELFEEVEFSNNKRFEDTMIMPRLFDKANKSVFYNHPKYYYRQRKDSYIASHSESLCVEYVDAIEDVIDFVKERFCDLDIYLSYLIVHATINTYNCMGLFDMPLLKENEKIMDIYSRTKEILEDKNNEIFIIQNLNYVRKLHMYYMIADLEGYLNNNKTLPYIYEENKII